ncbi:hypothetical protein ACSSS7_008271 [Eimeria intestinalis]
MVFHASSSSSSSTTRKQHYQGSSSRSSSSRGFLDLSTSSINGMSGLSSSSSSSSSRRHNSSRGLSGSLCLAPGAVDGGFFHDSSLQEGEDPDLRDAIAENVEALKKKEERLNHIREKMATIGARKDACVHNAPTATAAGAAAGAAAGGVAAAAERPKASSSASPSDKEGLPEEPAGSAAAPATATAATTAAAPTSAAATARATRDFANSETEGIAHLTDRLRQLSTSTADKGALSSSKEKDEGIYL